MFVITVFLNLGTAKKFTICKLGKMSYSSCHVVFDDFELELFLICNGDVLCVFDHFKSGRNASVAQKYILSTMTDLYFI